MTLNNTDTSNDAIQKFKKRKFEEHKANRAQKKFPEGFGGGEASSDRPAKRFAKGDRGPPRKDFKGPPGRNFKGPPGKNFKGPPGKNFRGPPPRDFKGGPGKRFGGPSDFKGGPGKRFGGPSEDDGDQEKLEKPDWAKIKQETKERKAERQMQKGNDTYELGCKIKKLWEELRQVNCKGKRREELSDKLLVMVKGKVKALLFSHDTVRVIETLLSVGQARHRSALFEEMKEHVVELSRSKYSRHSVLKILMYGTKEEKDYVIRAMKGHVVELTKHKTASDVVELAYNDYSNAKQRALLLQEFYGPEFRLFHDESITCLEDALKKHVDKRERILKDMFKYLQPILEKGVFTNTMVHTLLREFLTHCAKDQRQPIIEAIREGLLPILHTRDGARVGMLCLWHGTNKDRKTILKSFRTHFVKLATEKQGYLVLLAALDCMDDTEFMRKAVLSELMDDLPDLVASDAGMKVLRYLIAPRDPVFFHPCILRVLEEGDNNEASKKDTSLRREELQKAIRLPILRLILANLDHWAIRPTWTLFIGAALNALSAAESKTIFENLSKMFGKEYIVGSEDQHFLDVAHTVKMVSYIIKCDKKRAENDRTTFSSVLLNTAEEEVLSWINCNRGCFLCVTLIETELEDIVLKMKRILSPHKEKLATLEFKGAEVLLSKL